MTMTTTLFFNFETIKIYSINMGTLNIENYNAVL